jgi:hypothetical protein
MSVPDGPPPEDHYTYPNIRTADLMSSLTAEAQDSYFPYDPITGEFMRSFFPQSNEDGNWEC